MKLRTFIAIDIGPMDTLVELEHEISSTGAQVKLVEPENIHITLKFLGDTDEKLIEDIIGIMTECANPVRPFTLEFKGAGVFPNLNYMKVAWVGIENYEPIVPLVKELDTKLERLGFRAEKRAFKPHITLARVKGRLNKDALKNLIIYRKDKHFGELNVDSIYLKKSILKKGTCNILLNPKCVNR